MKLYLGVDGGQSSTTAWIGDETGRVLGSGSGGPVDHVGAAEGAEKLLRAVSECVGAACRRAGLDPLAIRFTAACLGMSGLPADKRHVLEEIVPADLLAVTIDANVALAGATAGEPGIVTIAGTGSIACGRNAAGRFGRAGGWGYIFGDEGGAFDIVRQALRAALRFEEGWGPATSLRAALLAATGTAGANDLMHRFYTLEWPRPRIAALARLVDGQAAKGDEAALQVLEDAAAQLAALAASVRGVLFAPGEAITVSYVGGVFGSRLLLERYRTLVETQTGNRCVAPIYGPAAGALLEAYRVAGVHPDLRDLPEGRIAP